MSRVNDRNISLLYVINCTGGATPARPSEMLAAYKWGYIWGVIAELDLHTVHYNPLTSGYESLTALTKAMALTARCRSEKCLEKAESKRHLDFS